LNATCCILKKKVPQLRLSDAARLRLSCSGDSRSTDTSTLPLSHSGLAMEGWGYKKRAKGFPRKYQRRCVSSDDGYSGRRSFDLR
jgi:hypothetical protein